MSRISSTFGRPKSSYKVPTMSESQGNFDGKNSKPVSRLSTSVEKGVCNHGKPPVRNSSALEHEYIKGLQQQVYVLELENNHLRQQTMKAVEIAPSMNSEADQMLQKLRSMQQRIDQLEHEVKRKDAEHNSMTQQLYQLNTEFRVETGVNQATHNDVLSEVTSLKESRDYLQSEIAAREVEIQTIRKVKDSRHNELVDSDTQISVLRSKLDETMTRGSTLERHLAEKRADMIRSDSRIRQLEDTIITAEMRSQDPVVKELQAELSQVRSRLREVETLSDRDKSLKMSLSQGASVLTEENQCLLDEIASLTRSVAEEKRLRSDQVHKKERENEDLKKLSLRERELDEEVRRLKTQIREESVRADRMMDQAAKQEEVFAKKAMETSMTSKRLVETNYQKSRLDDQNEQIKREQENLKDHIKILLKTIQEKDAQGSRLREQVEALEIRIEDAEKLRGLGEQVQSIKWGELEDLAGTLKEHARDMVRVSSRTQPLV